MTRYFSGDGYGLVSGLVLALLPADTEISQLNRLWDGLSGQPELTDLLQALTSQRSKTWPGWPAFALVMREDNGGLRLVVRGACQVRVTTATGEQVFDGRSVTTWREDTVSEPLRVCLTAVDGPVGGDGLPVACGIVRTSRLETDWLETDWTGEPLQRSAAKPSQAAVKPALDEPAFVVKPV
ncbi:MAG: hypothetical protein LBL92_02915, partial [Propionibacteriaceae bacterium]|nr:hypothetical protein [Propionibacteriaceae bacterium]